MYNNNGWNQLKESKKIENIKYSALPKGNIGDIFNNTYHTSLGLIFYTVDILLTLGLDQKPLEDILKHRNSCKKSKYGKIGNVLGVITSVSVYTGIVYLIMKP